MKYIDTLVKFMKEIFKSIYERKLYQSILALRKYLSWNLYFLILYFEWVSFDCAGFVTTLHRNNITMECNFWRVYLFIQRRTSCRVVSRRWLAHVLLKAYSFLCWMLGSNVYTCGEVWYWHYGKYFFIISFSSRTRIYWK